jgi:NADPH-dependent FMN reductase
MRILGICGSLQRKSGNLTLLNIAAASTPPHVEVVLFDGLLELPHFDPDIEASGPPETSRGGGAGLFWRRTGHRRHSSDALVWIPPLRSEPELQQVTVGIVKEDGRGRHPGEYHRLVGRLPVKVELSPCFARSAIMIGRFVKRDELAIDEVIEERLSVD